MNTFADEYSSRPNPIYQAAKGKKPKLPIDEISPIQEKNPSALEALGNLLDLPGSSIRDVVAWKNPFDQWLTPTHAENRTTGRDLLRHFKLADPETNSWGNAVAGFGAEVLTDPMTYTGIGAFTRAGKAASKAGLVKNIHSMADAVTKTPKQLIDAADDVHAAMRAWRTAGGSDDLLHRPIKAVVSFKPPKVPALELTGKTAEPVAKVLDAIGAKTMEIPGMRQLRAAFDPAVMNATTKAGQEIAQVRSRAVDDSLVDIGHKFAPLVEKPDPAKMSEIVSSVEKNAAEAGLDVSRFGDTPPTSLSSALQRSEHLTRATGMAHAALELLGSAATPNGSGVPLGEALARLRMDTPAARSKLAVYGDMSTHTIDEHLLADAARFVKPFTDPEVMSTARQAVQKFTNLFKTHVTIPFPAFHSRNFLSGQIQNIVRGFADQTQKGPARYVRPLIDGFKLTTGKTIRGLSKVDEFKSMGLSDVEATQLLKHEAFAYGLLGDTTVMSDLGAHSSRMPGRPVFSNAPEGTTWAQAANPLLVAGGMSKDTRFLPARIGGDVAQLTESLNRLSPYIAMRKSGYTSEEAARLVKAAQVDYGDVTEFERKYAKQFIPFWQFSKGMLETTLDELAHHPGGRTAVAIKANARSSQENKKPYWLGGQTTVPLDDGKTLSAGGLMTDAAANLLGAIASGRASDVTHDLATRLNPLVKHPIEIATGQSLFHGRPLTTVTPDIGGFIENIRQWAGGEKQRPRPFISQAVEHFARNTPFSRYLSSARKWTKRELDAMELAGSLMGASVD